MPESSPVEFTKTRKTIACRDGLVAHYGTIGSSAVRAALCVASKTEGEEPFDNRAGSIPAVLRDEDSAD